MSSERYFIVDRTSGTFFDAEHSSLIDTTGLTDEQLTILQEGSDEQRCQLAEEHGLVILVGQEIKEEEEEELVQETNE